jgi:hypothetical protein
VHGAQHGLLQAAHHRRDLGGGVADPGRQRRAVDLHPLAGHHLRLPIQRLMVGEAADHDVGDHRLGRQAALDQAWRRGLLHHHARAGAASKLRPPGDQHAVLRRDHVEPLGAVLADLDHHRLTARAGGVGRPQHHFDARQMGGQCAAAGTPFLYPRAPQHGIASLGFGRGLRNRGLKVLKAERELLLG